MMKVNGLIGMALLGMVIGNPVCADTPVAPPPSQESPFDFKGLKLGSTEKELLERFPEMKCGESPSASGDRLCYVFWKSECIGEKLHDCTSDKSKPWAYGRFPADVTVYSYNDSISTVNVWFSSDGFDEISEALTQKFGKPFDNLQDTVKNKMGASFINETRIWKKGASKAVLSKYSGTLTNSSLRFSLDSTADEFAKRRKQQAEQAAKDI